MNWNSVSHYEILQVAPTAPLSVIKASYKALIQQYHPDRYQPADEAERISRRLNEAYVALSDPGTRAKHDAFLREQRDRLDASSRQGTPPPPRKESSRAQHNPASAPEGDASGTDWKVWLAMLPFIYFSGHIGAGLMGGGIIPYLVGIAGGAVVFHGIKRLWQELNWAGKGLLILGWIAVCFSGITFKQMQDNEVSRQAMVASASLDNATATAAPAADAAPPSGFVLDGPSPQQTDPRDTYLQMHVDQLNDDQYNAAVNRWLESHSEVASVESQNVMSQLLQEVYSQYPRSALGPALDMALSRGLKAGAQEEAQQMAQAAASQAEAYSARGAATPIEGPREVPLPTYQPATEPATYPTQAQMDARRNDERASVEEASKGGLSGAYKRYDHKSGREVWVDASGNPLE